MTFYATLSRYYEEIFPCSQGVRDLFSGLLKGKHTLLDAGCGTGQLVRLLRREGADARGFDLDEEMVRLARQSLTDEAPPRDGLGGEEVFRPGDLTAPDLVFPGEQFDVISCLGNTIAHIPPRSAALFLKKVAPMIRPGGRLLIQTLNYPAVLAGRGTFEEIRTEHCLFKRRYGEERSDSLPFETELTDLVSDRTYSHTTRHYPLLPDQFSSLLQEAGFEAPHFFGSWDRGDVKEERLLLLVEAGRGE